MEQLYRILSTKLNASCGETVCLRSVPRNCIVYTAVGEKKVDLPRMFVACFPLLLV